MKNKNLIVVISIAVVILIGYSIFSQPQKVVAPTTDKIPTTQDNKVTNPTTPTNKTNLKASAPATTPDTDKVETTMPGAAYNPLVQVMYTSTGFAPASMVVKKGQKVRFLNHGSIIGLWVSAIPPIYPDFDQNSIANIGDSYEFTFDKVGTWNYTNRLDQTKTGTIIVK